MNSKWIYIFDDLFFTVLVWKSTFATDIERKRYLNELIDVCKLAATRINSTTIQITLRHPFIVYQKGTTNKMIKKLSAVSTRYWAIMFAIYAPRNNISCLIFLIRMKRHLQKLSQWLDISLNVARSIFLLILICLFVFFF